MCGHSEKNFCNEKKWFKFWPMMKNIFWKVQTNNSLVMACLQKYQEWLSLTTFHRVQLNSKVVTLLPMTKQVYLPEGYLSYQAKLFLVSWGHWELIPVLTMVRCVIWYHLYHLENVKNILGGVIFSVKFHNFPKSNTPPRIFFAFFRLYKYYQIVESITYVI